MATFCRLRARCPCASGRETVDVAGLSGTGAGGVVCAMCVGSKQREAAADAADGSFRPLSARCDVFSVCVRCCWVCVRVRVGWFGWELFCVCILRGSRGGRCVCVGE